MNQQYSPRQQQPQPRLAHPLGTVVYCVHCFQTLGTDTAATPRKVLVARHTCVENVLLKQPAAPPPYN